MASIVTDLSANISTPAATNDKPPTAIQMFCGTRRALEGQFPFILIARREYIKCCGWNKWRAWENGARHSFLNCESRFTWRTHLKRNTRRTRLDLRVHTCVNSALCVMNKTQHFEMNLKNVQDFDETDKRLEWATNLFSRNARNDPYSHVSVSGGANHFHRLARQLTSL